MSLDNGAIAPAGSVRSVERVLDLLFALQSSDYPLGVSELGRAAGLPKATAQRLLAVLERRGFVQKERGRYQLGAALVVLAGAFLAGNSLTRVALPVLEELVATTGETATLYVRNGLDRVAIQRVRSPHPLGYTLRLGQRLPLHLGAAGQVLSAAMPEAELRPFVERLGEIRLATGALLSREEFLAKLEQVRRQGFALSLEERETGVVSVAAPVLGPGKATLAAVAVTGPTVRMAPERIQGLAVEVRHAAEEVARAYSRS